MQNCTITRSSNHDPYVMLAFEYYLGGVVVGLRMPQVGVEIRIRCYGNPTLRVNMMIGSLELLGLSKPCWEIDVRVQQAATNTRQSRGPRSVNCAIVWDGFDCTQAKQFRATEKGGTISSRVSIEISR